MKQCRLPPHYVPVRIRQNPEATCDHACQVIRMSLAVTKVAQCYDIASGEDRKGCEAQ